MYRVLKDVFEEKGEGSRVTTSAKVGGRVRSAAAKEQVSKQLQKGINDMDALPLMDLKSGEIKANKKKKTPKEKTPEENAIKEAKTYFNKSLACTCLYVCLEWI